MPGTKRPQQLLWSQLVEPEMKCLVVRHGDFSPKSLLHTHDFAEVFLVESGESRYELDRVDYKLVTGDVVFVKPEDTHRFLSPTRDFAIINVAFPKEVLTLLAVYQRTGWAWNEVGFRSFRTHPPQTNHLANLAAELALSSSSDIRLSHFLLEVLLAAEEEASTEESVPTWLSHALRQWQRDQGAMRSGVAGLATLAGRSREHVSRTIKLSLGVRAIDILNAIRMDTAAAKLRLTDESIAMIAFEVGLPNLSHFYRVFNKRFGTTPHKFRVSQRNVVDMAVNPDSSIEGRAGPPPLP